MRKCIRVLALVLAMTMLLSVTALAADENDKATIKDNVTGAAATFDSSNPEIIHVTFTSSSLTAGQQYLILMVKGNEENDEVNYTITEDSILYIDQTAATDSGDGTATVTFRAYPSSIQDSLILITGVESGAVVAAIVEAKYILGDVDGDGIITTSDAAMLLRAVAGLQALTGDQEAAGNVDGDTIITTSDAAKILRVVAKLDSFE